MLVEVFTLNARDPPPAFEIDKVCDAAGLPATNWKRSAVGPTATLGAPACVTVNVTGIGMTGGFS